MTCFYDPLGSGLLLDNLLAFSAQVRNQGLKLLVVELAFGDLPFVIPNHAADSLVRVRSSVVLWQKERLLNLGISRLPAVCDKIAWLDADIVFENPDWVKETARMLERFVALQPFETAYWRRPAETGAPPASAPRGLGDGCRMPSMASVVSHHPNPRTVLADYFEHGHSGFAWAARRDVLQRHGLYDRSILGGGDIVIAHSLFSDSDFWRGRNWFCRQMTKPEISLAAAWGRRLAGDVQGSVSHVPGEVVHFWHGSVARRGYMERMKILLRHDFDPATDIAVDPHNECWRWATHKPLLHDEVANYFSLRQSNDRHGEPASVSSAGISALGVGASP